MTLHSTPVLWTARHRIALAGLLLLQFAAAYAIGTQALLTNPQASLFAPIAASAAIPVTIFLAAYGLLPRFRGFVLAQDLRTLTMLQFWRVVGFVYLGLYAVNALPALFALPAGFGDVAVGITAAFVVLRLAAGSFPGLVPGGVTTAAMDVWPLNLFPRFIVPSFMILQLAALLKIRALRRAFAPARPAPTPHDAASQVSNV